MLLTQVALVRYEGDKSPIGDDDLDELMRVAAALQTQVTRDLGPVWDVDAVVSPFRTIEEIPPTYFPLVIIDDPDLPLHGVHWTSRHRPFAVVKYVSGWPLAASHELLEFVVDPSCRLTAPGPSLYDDKYPAEPPQGGVDYLVEVSDPVERSTYEINGVLVSDFVTPHYYATAPRAGLRYSFTGRVSDPRVLLEGGYISWMTRKKPEIWQAFAVPPTAATGSVSGTIDEPRDFKPKELTVDQLREARSVQQALARASEPRLSRVSVNYGRDRDATETVLAGVSKPETGADALEYAEAFKKELAEFVSLVKNPKEVVTPEDLIKLRKKVAPGKIPSESDLESLLRDKVPAPPSGTYTWQDVVAAVRRTQQLANLFGEDIFDPTSPFWTAVLMP